MDTCDDHNLTCRETTVLVCGARDEALTAEQIAALQKHLQGCTYCRAASRQFADLFAQMDVLFAREGGGPAGGPGGGAAGAGGGTDRDAAGARGEDSGSAGGAAPERGHGGGSADGSWNRR